MSPTISIVFPLYDGLTHLDFTAPHQFLCRIPGARVTLASQAGGEIEAEHGLVFARTQRLEDVEQCDLICVPGGFTVATQALNRTYLSQVRRLARGARYITSVCNGSLILGAAGLLTGRRAACHWQWRHLLSEFGAVPDAGRVVRDGNVITGGGVTAGIDFALTVAAEIAGADFAQALQLGLEYAPAPPFNSGDPASAAPHILATVRARAASRLEVAAVQVREAASRVSAELLAG